MGRDYRGAQVADALKDVFPFIAQHAAANGLLIALDVLLIDTLHEAEEVYAGKRTEAEITELRRRLMHAGQQAEVKFFSAGALPHRQAMNILANREALAYMETMFGSPRKA